MMKASMDFSGFDALTKSIEEMGGNVEFAAQKALVSSHRHVTDKLEAAMATQKFNGKKVNWEHTGQSKESLRKTAEIKISGSVASVKTGFEWPTGARYVMYDRGSPRRIPASPGMRNALNSKKTKEEVHQIHVEALEDFLAETMRK